MMRPRRLRDPGDEVNPVPWDDIGRGRERIGPMWEARMVTDPDGDAVLAAETVREPHRFVVYTRGRWRIADRDLYRRTGLG